MTGTSGTRAAIVGAGAIGGWLADALGRAGWQISLVARGGTLHALHGQGLRVERADGLRISHPRAGPPEYCGIQDYVFLTVKAHHLPDLVGGLGALFGPSTVVVSTSNGIPWWFFRDFAGPLKDAVLESVDPQGRQAEFFPSDRTLGSVVHASSRVRSPGHIEVVAADRIIIGEPGGGASARVDAVAGALRAGGIAAVVSERIRGEVWAKLWGNMNMNPVSALTRSGTAAILDDAEVSSLCVRMMEEMQECAGILGLAPSMTPAQRIAVTRRLGDFRTSMLADVESGRPLEIAPQLGAVVEIAARLGVAAPFCRAILGLTRLLDARCRL